MPSRLTIVLPNTAMEGVPACRIDHPFARGLSVSPGPSRGSLQVTLVLGRLVAYSLTETGPGVFSLNLRLPRGAGMRLEDAVVVIDPGHGGKQTGCQLNVGDARLEEKALTLAIAKRVQAELRSLGIAHTFLTRADDSLVDLYERTRIAAAHNADLFVSIHVDEWARSTAACGPTAYYHRADESGRALAQSLIGHVGQASVTSSRGALSDGVLYANGLAVLRSATMPAALVECGFLTNPTDRKALVTDAYQAKLAKAIAEGIRGYLNASLPDPPTATANTE
jgi:N-acetylmuramoyl-L-alanine amidase